MWTNIFKKNLFNYFVLVKDIYLRWHVIIVEDVYVCECIWLWSREIAPNVYGLLISINISTSTPDRPLASFNVVKKTDY